MVERYSRAALVDDMNPTAAQLHVSGQAWERTRRSEQIDGAHQIVAHQIIARPSIAAVRSPNSCVPCKVHATYVHAESTADSTAKVYVRSVMKSLSTVSVVGCIFQGRGWCCML
jgi:hypothetical protein